MKSVNEQFEEMQKKTLESLEPMQSLNSVAAEAFEKIARKNYDLMGDLVDYAVAQVKLPDAKSDIKDVYEQRVADTKAFADKVNARAAEYVELQASWARWSARIPVPLQNLPRLHLPRKRLLQRSVPPRRNSLFSKKSFRTLLLRQEPGWSGKV